MESKDSSTRFARSECPILGTPGELLHPRTPRTASRRILSETERSAVESKDGPCCVYMVRCEGDWIYTGVSVDPQRRLNEHQHGGSRFTKGHRAIELLWTESHPTRPAAERRERQLKRWTRRKKLALAAGDLELLKRL